MAVYPLFFFLFGLIIGSFLNVVVFRLEKDQSFDGRSKCPSCGAVIRWYDNIPILSFFLLRQRCRVCRFPISWQYPAVEFVTGVLFALFGTLAIGAGSATEIVFTLWHLVLVGLLVTIAVYDARNMEIPLVLLATGIIAAIVYAFIATYLAGGDWFASGVIWQQMLWGGGIAAAIFYALVYFSKETWMGMGDVWLAGLAGAAVGLPALLFLFTLSFFIGALVGIGLLVRGERSMKSQIPFAPFLAVGTLGTVLIQAIGPWWLALLLLPV